MSDQLKKNYSRDSKLITMVDIQGDKVMFYDGKQRWTMTFENFEKARQNTRRDTLFIRTKPETQYKWIPIENGQLKRVKEIIHKEIEVQYEEYVNKANELLKLSTGELNLFRGEVVDLGTE